MELTMLPTELLLKIMAFLDHTDLVHLSAVNTLLHDMTQDEVCIEGHPPTIKKKTKQKQSTSDKKPNKEFLFLEF